MSVNYRETRCYLDTNILIYAFDNTNPAKQRLSKELILHFHRNRTGRVSIQVLAEWRNAMIKKFSHRINGTLRRKFIRYFSVWKPLAISPHILIKADELCERYSLSPYDSIHIQCALELNCQYFLSEDMQDGLVIDGKLTLCDPYRGLTP